MAKGQANSGIRMTRGRRALLESGMSMEEVLRYSPVKKDGAVVLGGDATITTNVYHPTFTAMKKQETDLEIDQRIEERFSAIREMTAITATGMNRALIVSGRAGLGKTHEIDEELNKIQSHGGVHFHRVAGYLRATAIYKLLYQNRGDKNVIVLDDVDSIFTDEVSLNILKAACDSTDRRVITWGSEYEMETDDGRPIPKHFEFHGCVIAITNLDLSAMIDKRAKFHEHFSALLSRSTYISTACTTNREVLVRIRSVVNRRGMLDGLLNAEQKAEVMEYVEENIDHFRDVSLRTVKKIAALRIASPIKWRNLVKVTCHRE